MTPDAENAGQDCPRQRSQMNDPASQVQAPPKPLGFFTRRKRFFAGLMLIILCTSVFGAWYFSPVPRANRTLACAGLAKLPKSARDLKLAGQAPTCVIARCLKFRADPADVNDFLRRSPSLKDLTPKTFDAGYRLSTARDVPWFKIDIEGKGRRYDIAFKNARAFLIIDQTTSTVYFRFSKRIPWWYRKLKMLRLKLK